ncbi:hypothetical protein FISHEDRAFT_78556 [Fistulina hepatica ATCC 64428]|nr:hypothetical protein FISHEDRAFT_78556 [Fistulina hepatica ATCC 64428]
MSASFDISGADALLHHGGTAALVRLRRSGLHLRVFGDGLDFGDFALVLSRSHYERGHLEFLGDLAINRQSTVLSCRATRLTALKLSKLRDCLITNGCLGSLVAYEGASKKPITNKESVDVVEVITILLYNIMNESPSAETARQTDVSGLSTEKHKTAVSSKSEPAQGISQCLVRERWRPVRPDVAVVVEVGVTVAAGAAALTGRVSQFVVPPIIIVAAAPGASVVVMVVGRVEV